MEGSRYQLRCRGWCRQRWEWRFDVPNTEKMIVRMGGVKCSLAKQHDDEVCEVDSFANASPQPRQAQLPPQVEVPSPPAREVDGPSSDLSTPQYQLSAH